MTDENRRMHRYYLQREYHLRNFVYVRRRFADSEEALIRRFGYWMMALERGYITPLTAAQEHFVSACKGEAPQITVYEKVWIRYTNAAQDDKAEVAGRKAAKRSQSELVNNELSSHCTPCNGTGMELSIHGISMELPCSYCGGSGTNRDPEPLHYYLDPIVWCLYSQQEMVRRLPLLRGATLLPRGEWRAKTMHPFP